MWKHCCLFVCALGALLFGGAPFLNAQDPTTQPLIQFSDLSYIGAFRLPRAASNGDDLSFGGRPFTFNPAKNSLFVGSAGGRVSEVSIPSLVSSTDVNSMFLSSYLQGLYDPMEGNLWQVASEGASLHGLLVDGSKLYGTAAIYYDAQNTQRVSHYARSTTLSSPSFQGVASVWQADLTGFVSGYLASVPPEWQSKLGGRAITGQCCTPIAWKTSWGPAAFAWNPGELSRNALVPASPLLYYNADHPTLGQWNASGEWYGATARMDALVLIAGTRTALFFGSIGTGTPCYGNGTNNQSLHMTPSPDGTLWCYDPTNTDKGSHAYPYRYQIWAYDLNDFAAVKAGTKKPWEIIPYGVWPFSLPIPEIHARLGGVAYDAQRQVLYISQMFGDADTFANRALIHALRINRAPASLPAPTATTGPTPSGSGTVKTVTLTPSLPSPQKPGTTITWTAAPSGGITPYEYKWVTSNGSGWVYGNWTNSNTLSWTPTNTSQYHRVSVWVRSYGATADVAEAAAESYYTISGDAVSTPPPTTTSPTTTSPTTSPTAKATAVSISSNLPAPQSVGTTITWTATPTGGVAPHQYQWWIYDGVAWTETAWSTSNTYAWTPARVSDYARVSVWVRSAGSTASIYEASTEKYFAIKAATTTTTAPPPATTTPTARVSSVALTTNLAAPQPAGTTITWTATPTGGAAPHQYKWMAFDGATWTTSQWTTSNTYAWRPTAAAQFARVAVWVRSAGATADLYEASAEKYFTVTAPTTTSSPPPPTTTAPTAKVTSVSISANMVAPQPLGTTVTWTAIPVGGVGPHQYQWHAFDGTTWTATAWSTSNTFAWKPAKASPYARVSVWVRSAGNTANIYEASTETYFAIK